MKKHETYGAGEWIKSDHFEADETRTGTIESVGTHTFEDGQAQRYLSFSDLDGQFGLNVTNWDMVAELSGQDDDDNWAGTQVEIYKTTTRFGAKTVPCLRIRKPANGTSNGAAEPAPAPSSVPVLGKAGAEKLAAAAKEAGGTLKALADALDEAGHADLDPENAAEWPRSVAPACKAVFDSWTELPF